MIVSMTAPKNPARNNPAARLNALRSALLTATVVGWILPAQAQAPAQVAHAATAAAASTSEVVLNETGSTLIYPLFQRWISAYAVTNPGIKITAAATNSGEGIRLAIAGRTQIGTSDAYLSDEEAQHNPRIVDIPLAIAAQTVNYNVPGLNGAALRLDGTALAGIYSGTIRNWDAAPIAELNPGVKLPHDKIIAVHRADPSGDTFVFTQFLGFAAQNWQETVGFGTTVAWPKLSDEPTATGNAGMVQTLAATPFSIGYVGISFSGDVGKAGLGTVMLKNQAGKFVAPTAQAVDAAAATLDARTPADERLSLVYAPGDASYPLVNYEYAVVSTTQADAGTAAALRRFLLWSIALNGGNAAQYLDIVGFIPLPDSIRALSEKQITRIK